ncbi:MAG: amino acid adenylation domain-containing protein, partial [Chloroflexi bacterium]|nr:amino acid adenylation domain-containing protein [Chloroflexota bacterium]
FEMTFALDVQALQRSVITIIERHEVLRTRFEMMDEQPVQVIHPTDGFTLPMTDLSDKQKAEQDATWQTLSDEDAQRPFNFTQDYLIRFHLVRFSNTHYRLILTLHHIAFDGWSWGVLLRELTALYAAFSQGKPNPLTPLSIQYADFSVWQRQPQQQQKYEKQLAYWQQQLQDAPAALELPTDFARTAVPTYQGAAYELTLPPELGVQIKSLLQTAELTPFTLYFAAFSLLLYRYTGQDDIVIGTPVANRLLREVEPLIGFFVNTLALRLRLSPTMTISDLLQQARQVMLDAQGNQDVPFESVVQAVQPDRELSRQPLFQVMVLAQEDGESRMDDAFPASISVGDSRTAKFDLLISFAPSGSSLLLEYSTDLFAEDTIARMAAHMQVLLTALVQNPTQTVSQIPLLTRLERTQLLHDWNETAVSTNLNRGVHHLFEAQAEQTPDAPAVTFGNTTWTYRELDERANQLAHYLIEAGITLDSRVGVCMYRSLEMVVSVLGILKAGAAYVPLDPAYPEERLVYMMENAETAVLLTQSTLTSPPHRHTVLLDQMGDKLGRYPKSMVETAVSGQNLLYVIYTSGSTGQPKGIAMPHAPMVNIMQWHKTQTRMHDSARTLQFSSFSFDVSCQEMFTTWMTGGTLVLIDEDTQRDAQQLLTFLHTKSIERLFLPFVALQQLAEVAEASDVYPQTLTHVVTAGEQLQSTRHIVNFCNHLPHCRLHNHYGPAETHVVSAYTLSETPEEWDALPSIGTPVANTQLYILDGQMAPVPVGVSGMLYIGGDHISRGYMARPRLTAERYIPNPFGNNDRLYKTGDLARYLADGRIQFLGRRDFQVKIRGYRIELGELETILNQHPQVRRAVVAAPIVRQANAPDERRLVAYVVPVHADETGVEEELRQFLLAQMPSYMVPGFFMFLETLPKTPSGKIDRRHLPTPGVSPTASFVPPRDVVELKLAELWQEVLGLTAVGIHDNFFSVGGHSLLAVRMVSRMQALFGQTVPVAALFQNSSIAQLAAILRNKGDFSTMSPLVKIREQGSNPPLFLVHPGGGNVLPYVELAQYVDAERPLYGFQSLGLTAHDQIQYTIEEMATTYVEALKDVQPHGPYALGGWSMGGTVALEMAQQLQANGDEIAHLILIDTDAPLTAAEEAAFDTLTFQISFARDMGITPEELRALNLAELDEAERLTAVLTYAISVERLPADLTLETVRHLYHVFETNYRAMVAYTPERPYAGHVTLLKAEEEPRPDYDSTFNWQPWVTGWLDVHIVPGNHFTLVRPPHLTTLATQINTALNYEKETMRL